MKDIVCLSHLRWDFVYQRPQHLMNRFAKSARVFFFEEPEVSDGDLPHLVVEKKGTHLKVCRPMIPKQIPREWWNRAQRILLQQFMADERIDEHILWYYTPMALDFTDPDSAS